MYGAGLYWAAPPRVNIIYEWSKRLIMLAILIGPVVGLISRHPETLAIKPERLLGRAPVYHGIQSFIHLSTYMVAFYKIKSTFRRVHRGEKTQKNLQDTY